MAYDAGIATTAWLIWLGASAAALAQAAAHPCAAKMVPAQQQILFGQEIAAFQKKEKEHPPRHGAILFVGSSILRCWETLEHDMRPLPVLNRAFGGARTWEVLHYMDRIVLPYKPRIILYYCGSNDISYHAAPEEISCRFQLFAERVHQELPQALIFFVSIIKAPQKAGQWPAIDLTNAMVKGYCQATAACAFIDLNPIMFDRLQQPRPEFYLEDGLHLRPAAYKEMCAVIKPLIEQAWSRLAAQHEAGRCSLKVMKIK